MNDMGNTNEDATVNEDLHYEVDPLIEPEEAPDMLALSLDPPEKIIRDLLATEKDMATEAMRALQSKYEHEREQWEKIFEDKQRDILALRSRLVEADDRIKKLQERANEDRQIQIEQMRMNARDMEAKRLSDTKKWEMIADELRDFREIAQEAQKKLMVEHEQLQQSKKQLAVQEECWKGQVNAKEDELLEIKEKLLKKEEILLSSQTESGEKISALQEQTGALTKTIEEERIYNARVNEKKDADLAMLKKGLQDAVISINAERQKKEETEENNIELKEQLRGRDEELAKVRAINEQELLEWKRARQEETAAWEKSKQEFVLREEADRKELEERLKMVSKSLAIAEQQLSEERRMRADNDETLKQKEQDLARSASEKDETVTQWRQILESEQLSWKKNLADIQAEFDRVRQAKDEEVAGIRKELKGLSGALDEEKRLCEIEKEENEQNRTKLQHLDEDRQRLIGQLENKEKEWQIVLVREQELLQKQIEELRAKSDAQIQSREMELSRLNEDLSILNGQLHELRQKFSLERNENNNRLSRIQEFEVQVRTINERHNQERLDWERKIEMLKDQIEQQRKSSASSQEELEGQTKRDLQLYRDKINKLTTQLSALQKKVDFDAKVPSDEAGTGSSVIEPQAVNNGSITSSKNRYYPGK